MAKDRLLGNYGMCIALSIIVSVISSAVMFLCEFATGIYRYPCLLYTSHHHISGVDQTPRAVQRFHISIYPDLHGGPSYISDFSY